MNELYNVHRLVINEKIMLRIYEKSRHHENVDKLDRFLLHTFYISLAKFKYQNMKMYSKPFEN